MKKEEISIYIKNENFKVTDHALEEMDADGFLLGDVIYGIINGEIIEEYPGSYPLPACLINSNTPTGEPMHICISMPPIVKIITVYKPDPNKWENGFKRRKKK